MMRATLLQAPVSYPRRALYAAELPAGLGLAEGVDADPPGEEQVDRLGRTGGEDAGILEKEGPLLREEQRKAGEVGALLIDLDLREVGVVREVEGETGRHAILDLAADLPPPAGLGIDRVVAFHARERVWRDRPHPSGRHLDTLQRPGTRHLHQTELARNEGPKRLFVLAADRAHEVESPRLPLTGAMAQRRERDAELGVPPA